MARSSLKNVMKLIDEANIQASPEKSFLQDLQRSIEMDEVKNKRPPSKTYKPSGMNCMRASYYTITGVQAKEDEMGYSIIGICSSGSETHERIQKAVAGMKDNNMDCEYVDVASYVKSRELDDIEIVSKQGMETKLYHKIMNMSFLCDGIIKYKNHYYILELKTETTNKFWNRNGVDPGHYMQAKAYCTALHLDEVIFVYICRDNSQMKSFLYTVTDEMKEEVLQYIYDCNEYIKNGIVPPQLDDKRKCRYCGYKEQCGKDN